MLLKRHGVRGNRFNEFLYYRKSIGSLNFVIFTMVITFTQKKLIFFIQDLIYLAKNYQLDTGKQFQNF